MNILNTFFALKYCYLHYWNQRKVLVDLIIYGTAILIVGSFAYFIGSLWDAKTLAFLVFVAVVLAIFVEPWLERRILVKGADK